MASLLRRTAQPHTTPAIPYTEKGGRAVPNGGAIIPAVLEACLSSEIASQHTTMGINRILLVLGAITGCLTGSLQAAGIERIVYPQAAVGRIGDQRFEIELRLGNRDPNHPWEGRVRLLRGSDLRGMQDLRVIGPDGEAIVADGSFAVALAEEGSCLYRISSEDLQVGVLVVENDRGVGSIVPSFFYRLLDSVHDLFVDLVAVQPVRRPGLLYDAMVSRTGGFGVGIALVAESGIDAAGGALPPTDVTVRVVLDDGESYETVVRLGGPEPDGEPAQKALFPHELLDGLPQEFEAARIRVSASDPVYTTLLGVGSPPLFRDVQIGAVPAEPAEAAKFPLRPGWEFVPGGADLTSGAFWECAGPRIVEHPGGLVCGAAEQWQTSLNRIGSRLEVDGDFSLLASVHASEGESGTVIGVGRLSSGPEWWSDLRRIDFGAVNGRVTVLTWRNSPAPETHNFLDPGTLKGQVELELARVGKEFRLFAGGEQVGALADFGLTEDGPLYLGTNVGPGRSLTVYGLAAAMPVEAVDSVSVVKSLATARVPPRDPSLRARAELRGIHVGAAVNPDLLAGDERYRETLGGEFNMLTAENVMKWSLIHPEPDRFNFCPADVLAAFADANAMAIRGHTLVWHQQIPAWLESLGREELTEVLRRHIFTVVGRYRGLIREWDVINEAVDDRGSLRDSIWLRIIGEEYLDLAFRWAHEADPSARLFYNDYGAETLNLKSDRIYAVVGGMLERGVPIHGVGFQAHVGIEPGLRPSRAALSANLARFRDLGLETNFTEVDVRVRLPADADKLAAQSEVYRDLLEVCLDLGSCASFVTWGFTDAHSWVPGFFGGYGAALPFDEDYRAKAAYHALMAVLGD
jgi:endo-1,4-beta-xylanase